jgi:thioredoxin-like negative regulator of GroEL
MLRVMFLSVAMLLSPVLFATEQPFSKQLFDDLRQRGKPVLVFIHADWCPTCNRQAVILSELFTQDEYKPIEVLRVDFDNQKSVVDSLAVRNQSTLILFHGDRELGRSTADTDKSSIAKLLRKAL